MRRIILGMTLVLGLLTGCEQQPGEPGDLSIRFEVFWQSGVDMDISVLVQGQDNRGPFPRNNGHFDQSYHVPQGKIVQVIAQPEASKLPEGEVICRISYKGKVLPKGEDKQKERGECHATAKTPIFVQG